MRLGGVNGIAGSGASSHGWWRGRRRTPLGRPEATDAKGTRQAMPSEHEKEKESELVTRAAVGGAPPALTRRSSGRSAAFRLRAA